ncbi:polysaccharide lyase 8 family protein [Ruania alkalisoli]|uniref:Polysaccharide lyase 8 family protein n=1 Tax=Ruania alkalisoli TaxID=2779775 RepID=A0A7M1STM8_9MICO|nr:polysaccharide lyase 8 family protein [Ruania alkalisoli]QOR70811.1 polysaccharide lyase 8 family protein [Ruania alkalisoli]
METSESTYAMIKRSVIRGTGVLSAEGTILQVETEAAAAAPPFDDMRARWAQGLIGANIESTAPEYAAIISEINSKTEYALARLEASSTSTAVFTDIPLGSKSQALVATAVRIQEMATAFAVPGTDYTSDGTVLNNIIEALEALHRIEYHVGATEYDNWHNWEIGCPQVIIDTLILCHEGIPTALRESLAATVDYFTPDPNYMTLRQGTNKLATGANLVDLCRVVAVAGLAVESPTRVAAAASALPRAFGTVTAGDGFHADGGFIQHNHVPYTGGYGLALLKNAALVLPVLAGTTWEVTDPRVLELYDAIEAGYIPAVFNARMMDSLRGRYVAVETSSEYTTGHLTLEYVLRLADGLDPGRRSAWRAVCKGWLDRCAVDPINDGRGVLDRLPRVALFNDVRNDSTVAVAPEPVEHRSYGSMARSMHRRSGWAVTVAASSKRIAYFEHGGSTGENLRGWHQGLGMTYVYDDDSAQYADSFWPTVDPYKLPGTTTDQAPLADGAGGAYGAALPASAFGGGTTDGEDGCLGQVLSGLLTEIHATKSWFFIEDVVIQLGAAISGASGHPIYSVLSNRKVPTSTAPAVHVDGVQQPVAAAWSGDFTDPSWTHDGRHGVVLLESSPVSVAFEERSGSWAAIRRGGSTDAITRSYLTQWIDHGVDPEDSSYAFALLPTASAKRTAAFARNPGVTVLSNSADIQAVRSDRARLVAANFFTPGSLTVGRRPRVIYADAPCSVMIRRKGGCLQVSLSDPTQESTSLELRLEGLGASRSSGDRTVAVAQEGMTAVLTVDVSGGDGRSHHVQLVQGV